MTTTKLFALALAAASLLRAEVNYIDNGRIRIGIDLDLGGAVTYLAAKGGDNLINSADFGRQIQVSFYGGPRPYGDAHPSWKNWPWNPIGSGDVYKHRSRVLHHKNSGRKLWVESVPMQWALNNVPCECTVETWIELEGNVAKVRSRLNNARSDKQQYRAFDQELPAVYTNGPWHHLWSVDEAGALRELVNQGPPWTKWRSPEHWAALLDDKGFGLGVFHRGVTRFTGGFHGKRGSGGPRDGATGYIAPIRQEILDHNIRYEYEYQLILGTLEEIRSYARSHTGPHVAEWRFRNDRQHWTLRDAADAGWPIRGAWAVRATGPKAALVAPDPLDGTVEIVADRGRQTLPVRNGVVELQPGTELRIRSIRLVQR